LPAGENDKPDRRGKGAQALETAHISMADLVSSKNELINWA